MPTRIINLTPHDVTVYDDNGNIIATIPRSRVVARVSQSRVPVGTLDYEGAKIPLVRTEYGDVQGLPPHPTPDTYYIVSTIVAWALKSRPEWTGHILVPDTGPGSRISDEQGRVKGVKYLILY